MHNHTRKVLIWLGSSREDLRALPAEVRRSVGYQLDRVQRGEPPHDWKPIAAIGPGVREIRLHEAIGSFRVLYLATRPEGIYVLHCFQKKTRKMSRRDLRLARVRFKAIPTTFSAWDS